MEWLSELNVSSISSINEKNEIKFITDDFIRGYLKTPTSPSTPLPLNYSITIQNEIFAKYDIKTVKNITFNITSNPIDFPVQYIILKLTPSTDEISFNYNDLEGPSSHKPTSNDYDEILFKINGKTMSII